MISESATGPSTHWYPWHKHLSWIEAYFWRVLWLNDGSAMREGLWITMITLSLCGFQVVLAFASPERRGSEFSFTGPHAVGRLSPI